jgi:hypothetical protein
VIGVAEKVVWALAALVLLALAGALVLFGLPSTTPMIAMESKQLSAEEVQGKLSAEQKKRLAELQSGSSDGAAGTGTRGPGRAPSQTYFGVNDQFLERYSSKNDCIAELYNAQSEILEDGSLKIFGIQEGCLLSKIGLKDNDILEGVDGKTIDFRSTSQYIDSWQDSLERLRGGYPISVEIKRKGARHQLVVVPNP